MLSRRAPDRDAPVAGGQGGDSDAVVNILWSGRRDQASSPATIAQPPTTESLMNILELQTDKDGIHQQEAWRFREEDGSMVAERNSEPDYASVADFDDVDGYDFCVVPDSVQCDSGHDLFGAGCWDTTDIIRASLLVDSLDHEELTSFTSATRAYSKRHNGPGQISLSIRSFEPLPSIPPDLQPRRRLESIPSLTDDTSESVHTPPPGQTMRFEDLAAPPGCPSPSDEEWPDCLIGKEDETLSLTEDEYATNSNASDEIPALAEDHPLRLIIPDVTRSTLLAYKAWKQRTAGTTNHSGPNPAGSSSHPQGTANTGSGAGGSKRPRMSNGSDRNKYRREEEDGEEEDDPRPPKRQSKGKDKVSDPALSFACPFYRNNPFLHRMCIKKTLNRFCDVKYHLQREHSQPRYCGRCKETMSSEETWLQHQEALSCEVIPGAPIPLGWTQEMRKKIQAATPRGAKDDEKWQIVYKAFFPNDGRTLSPWNDHGFTHEQEELRAFVQSRKAGDTMRRAMERFGLFPSFFSEEDKDAVWHEAYLAGTDAIFKAFFDEGPPPPPLSLGDGSGSSSSETQRADSIPEHQGVRDDMSVAVFSIETPSQENIPSFNDAEMKKFFEEIDAQLAEAPEVLPVLSRSKEREGSHKGFEDLVDFPA